MPLDDTDRSALARELLLARAAASRLPLVSQRRPGFSLADAYAVARETVAIRRLSGEAVCGYKIGFTNRSIWPRYDVHAPIWAPVWSSTVHDLQPSEAEEPVLGVAGFCQPRLEPEVVFGFGRAPLPGMGTAERLACVDWAAPGFEVVHTHFADWRFTAPDTVADFALHGALLVGPRRPLEHWALPADGRPAAATGTEAWARCITEALSGVSLRLLRDGTEVDRGRGSAVLDGPVQALMHWLDAMAVHTPEWTVDAGHVVTTGTLTDAAPIAPGQVWSTETDDPRLAGLQLRIGG